MLPLPRAWAPGRPCLCWGVSGAGSGHTCLWQFQTARMEAPDPVSGEPALQWVVPGSPGEEGSLRSRHCPGSTLDFEERALGCLSSPAAQVHGPVFPRPFWGRARAGTVPTQCSLTWAGRAAWLTGPSAPPWSCPRAGPRWKQVRGAPAQPLAGLCPRRTPRVALCHIAVLCSLWPRALGVACPFPATQSILTPLGLAGRGQEGDEQGAGLRVEGCLGWPRDLGGTWASKAGGGEGGEGRGQGTGQEVSGGPDLGFGWGAPGCGGERTRWGFQGFVHSL